MTLDLEVISLSSISKQGHARLIFDKVWSSEKGTEITPNLLMAMVHNGAYLSGAFSENVCVAAPVALVAVIV